MLYKKNTEQKRPNIGHQKQLIIDNESAKPRDQT